MSEPHAPKDGVLRDLLAARPVIALVGASDRPDRPSHSVMLALLDAGYEVIPVNPRLTEILRQRCFPALADVPRRVTLVDVFRRAPFTPPIAAQAAEIGARTLWLQVGVVNDEAAAIARRAGLIVVMDRCLSVEHQRLIGRPFAPGGAARPPDPVGLCRDCRHARPVAAERATYWMCRRSLTDPAFPKYPRLPVVRCRGFEWSVAEARGAPPGATPGSSPEC